MWLLWGREEVYKRFIKKWDRDIEWIDLAQNMDRWRALVNVVTNLWVP
jgi:hypothetical protein